MKCLVIMADPPSLGRRRSNRLDQYESWSKYLASMKQLDKYADTLFMLGLASFYNVSVRIISDIHDEAQVYYLGFRLQWMLFRYISSNLQNTVMPQESFYQRALRSQHPCMHLLRMQQCNQGDRTGSTCLILPPTAQHTQ